MGLRNSRCKEQSERQTPGKTGVFTDEKGQDGCGGRTENKAPHEEWGQLVLQTWTKNKN